MTVVKETSISRYVGDTADTKPTSVPVGSTYLDRQTGALWVCYDGTNWAQWDKLVKLVAGTAVVGKVRLSDSAGDDVTNATLNSVVVTNPTADNLKADVNLQVGDADVGAANKVPVDDADTQTLLGAGLPAALAAGGGLKVEGVAGGVAQPISVGGAVPGTITEADASKVAVTVAGHAWDSVNWRRLTANNVNDGTNAGVPSLWTQAVNLGYNGTFNDRLRTIAGSGAGLGVLKVGTMGELLTLAASAARTTGANGTAVTTVGWRRRYIVLLDVTVLAAGAGDLLNVYIDFSPDGTTWYNAVHFTQKTGTDAVFKEIAVLDPSAPGAVVIDVTSDAASGAVRPALFGPQIRARWAITDGGGGTQSFTFSVVAYAQ